MKLGTPLLIFGFAIGILFSQMHSQKALSKWSSEVTRSSVNACIKGDKLP